MDSIYNISMTVNFLLQATRVLQHGNYDDDELAMVTNFMVAIDDEILSDYSCTSTILTYDTDLELYIEIINELINVYEDREEYEICCLLKERKDSAIKITNKKTI
jgi:hypothetical protein